MKLWTATLDLATPRQGRTLLVYIARAQDAWQLRAQCAVAYGGHLADKCTVEEGLVCNEVSFMLLSEAALSTIEQSQEGTHVRVHAMLHVS